MEWLVQEQVQVQVQEPELVSVLELVLQLALGPVLALVQELGLQQKML